MFADSCVCADYPIRYSETASVKTAKVDLSTEGKSSTKEEESSHWTFVTLPFDLSVSTCTPKRFNYEEP